MSWNTAYFYDLVADTEEDNISDKVTMFGDTYGLLRKSNAVKAVNYLKVISSFYRSRLRGRAQVSGMPVSVSIEPTTSCNLRCPECPSGLRSFTRPTGMLDLGLYKDVLDQLGKELSYLTLYFQGEPYLHKGFFDMVEYAARYSIYTSTSTNGHYLDDENAEKTVASGLDRLIISLDGLTQEVYEKYRVGGELEKVMAGIENIAKWKKKLGRKTPHTVIQFLVMKHNESQMAELKGLAKEPCIDEVSIKTMQVYVPETGIGLLPENEDHRRYAEADEGALTLKGDQYNHCWRMWQGCVITWDGKVVPCCFDKDAKYVLGDLREQSFREIWQGEEYDAFRNRLLSGRKEIDICRNCSEGTKVFV